MPQSLNSLLYITTGVRFPVFALALGLSAQLFAEKEPAPMEFSTYDTRTERVTIEVTSEQEGLRSYRHSTTQALRDDKPRMETYAERQDLPRLRSGNSAFDGLFALAVNDMLLDSVSEIRDASYNNGEAIDCECFETGEKWNYVWTRDLSYAAHLGLGFLDPRRVTNSLLFKTSEFRQGVTKSRAVAGSPDGLQIIQDTGSGGSWPVSTDRVSWAFGAESVLDNLAQPERDRFARTALKALTNTLENDRLAAFDADSGLYTGEQSFLDWREQSYSRWIADDLSFMSTSKALSTNVDHYRALTLAASLASEFNQPELAKRYDDWAEQLKQAINRELWLEDKGLYSSLTAGHFDNAAMPKFDWLGQSLAILSGIADEDKRDRILASYPHGPMGAPVIYPQQPGVPVYHNRGIWPFVTAYGLYAAIAGENVAVADRAMATLVRGAALNISNMENLEWLSGEPLFKDPRDTALSGPVINSRRQLWSVAAYLGMVIHGVFGVQAEADVLHFRPFLTTSLRQRFMADSNVLLLQNLSWKGKRFDVRLHLPAVSDNAGFYAVDQVELDGRVMVDGVPLSALNSGGQVDIRLGDVMAGQQSVKLVESDPREFDQRVYSPVEPRVGVDPVQGYNLVTVSDSHNRGDLRYNIFRNGKLVAHDLPAGEWRDNRANDRQACYAASAVFASSGNESHHSQVACVESGEEIAVSDTRVVSNIAVTQSTGASLIRDWGAPEDSFRVEGLQVLTAGRYAVQIKYHNALNDINTGITCGVKWLRVREASGTLVAEGVVQLPHASAGDTPVSPVYSTPIKLRLKAGEYRIELADFYNMSYLRSNQTYVGVSGAGGLSGAANRFDIYAIRLLPLE